TLKNNYLNKIVYVSSYLDVYDTIIWIDDDAFFFDFEKDIMDYAPKNDSFISLCKSPNHKELKTFFSSGQFIVKSNELSKQFFKDVLETELSFVKDWWTDNLGYFTNGDQDIMIYLLLEHEAYKNKMDLYDYKCFNSRCENLFDVEVHKPLILHFTGRGKTKHENILKVQNKLNIHLSMVANSLLSAYNIEISDTYSNSKLPAPQKSLISRLLSKLKKWL